MASIYNEYLAPYVMAIAICALPPFTRYSQFKQNAKTLTLKMEVKVEKEKNGTCAIRLIMFDSILKWKKQQSDRIGLKAI